METTTLAKSGYTSTTLQLENSFCDRYRSLAAQKRRTTHYLMQEALEHYLKVEEHQQKILQSVDDSIDHFEATGLHITLEEVEAWAKELKTNPHAKLPPCHL
jgi:predicted transcriptional regulator